MLGTRSLDTMAIDDIAAEAGISRGLLFHYFPTKRDFHVAVARAAA
jgi:AcrR family transcriptional regulator